MSVFEAIAKRLGVRWLRSFLEGKKEYLWVAAGVAVIVANKLGVPVAADLEVSDTQAVASLIVAGVVAARRAKLNRDTNGSG